MSDTLARQDSAQIATQQTESPVAWAIANGVPAEQMLAYYNLQREMKSDAARNAFNEAFALFKAEAVAVVKNVKVAAGPLAGTKYADLFGVVSAVIPALAKHGLSHSWKLTKDDKDWMEVTCTIRHRDGHSETVSMGAAPDSGPGRNAIQARGSAKTYLERYTLLAATGLAAQGEDTDGNGKGVSGMPDTDFIAWRDAIANASDLASLKKSFEGALKAADVARDMTAKGRFIDAKDKRKGELQ